MSAKEFYHAKPIHMAIIDLIPPEIWSTIFRHAAGPDVYEHGLTASESLDFISCIDREQFKDFRASLVTRRYLVRVNKAWYEMASPFLYEYILLGTGRSIIPLRNAMTKSQRLVDLGEPGCSSGWWTKRLDVSMRDKAEDPNEILAALADIMACLPNLQILTFSVRGQGYNTRLTLPSHVLGSLSCRESLKTVHWYTDYLRPEISDWTLFLENHSQLESLRGNSSVTGTPNKHITLGSLKTIHQCFYSLTPFDLMNLNLPAVRSAVYNIDIATKPSMSFNNAFFSQLGSQLSTIQIDSLYGVDPEDFASTFSKILQECHKLVEIRLNLSTWHTFNFCIPGKHFPPTVKILGIRITGSKIPNRDTQELFTQTLPAIVSQNVDVKIIQFMSKGTVRALQGHPSALTSGLQQIAALGLSLLNHDGCPLSSRFVPDSSSSWK